MYITICEIGNLSKFDETRYSKSVQRDGMGRDVGGEFRMGDTCTPMADSCQCMAKTITIL